VEKSGERRPHHGVSLSCEQQRLWALHQQMPESPLCTVSVALSLRGSMDADALRAGLAAFVERHEIWRTTFPSVEGRPLPVVGAQGRWTWSVADLSARPEAERPGEARRRAEYEAGRPFDLARGPLVRALLVRMGDQEHRLFLTLHRMIFDRASLTQVLLPELRELYEARVQGRPVELEESLQYASYVTWQLDEKHRNTSATDVDFWRDYVAGAPALLELPRDHPRPAQRTFRAASQAFALSEELTARLRELGQQEQATLATTFGAAFATLLYRYTGQEDLLVGLAQSGHEQGQWRRTMGCFVNTVVVRADLTEQPTVLEVLKRTRATIEATHPHGHVPFDAVVEAVAPDPSPGHHPLVQALLVFEPQPGDSTDGWSVVPSIVGAQTSEFDLCLELEEQADGLAGRFVYNRDIFEPETVARMVGHWHMLLESMVANPGTPVGELRLLAPPERRLLLGQWSAGEPVVEGSDIATLIAEQAMRRPDAVAVVCEGTNLTYGQLNRRANQLARYLRNEGVKPEVPVGVCLERSPDQLVALLGIFKAGGVYVPLDPEAPAERIQYVLQDTQMPLVLTHERLRAKVTGAGSDTVSLDRTWDVIAEQFDEEPDDAPNEGQLAYIVYTSGSTGQPKGVMIERGAISAHSRSMIATYALGPEDRVLQFSQYTADASLEQILPTLAAGGCLIMRGTEIWTPAELLEELKNQHITVMNLWPAYFQQAAREWGRTPEDLVGMELRLVIVGGERLGPRAVQLWRELALPGARLLNGYGPTESTITATFGEAGQEHEQITIGRPLPGRNVYILDPGGRPVPARVVGELHIGGALLARGYLNRAELTAERFVADPFGPGPGGRLYRTGDLARYLGDGRIEYIGRQDEQVKIRGYRIELGEVESVLAQHPAVEEAVVVAREDSGDAYLVAFVVGRTTEPLQGELRRYLEEKLPRYMQPAAIEQLEQFSRLASGKPDRRRLPEVERGKRNEDAPYLAPRLLVQQQLVQVWEELLDPRPIGIRDNFFHLGGHSLLAAQLVSRIEQVWGKRLALSTLFAKPTIEQLAEVLHQGGDGGERKAQVQPVQVNGERRPFFFLHGDWTGGAFYCFALARACGEEQPFYVLEPYTFSRDEQDPTIDAIATAHIEAMRGVQPSGPYRLGGFCNGGLLAYEMARQLEAAGETVEFLGLVNPSVPIQFSMLRRACDTVSRMGRFRNGRQADLYLRTRHALRHVYLRLQPGASRVQDFGQLLEIDPRLKAFLPPRDALYQDYVGVLSWAAAAYKTGVYGGKITFYWAREEPTIPRTWEPVIRGKRPSDVEEHVVEGTHMSCVTDYIQDLADVMGECLSRVENETSYSEFPEHTAEVSDRHGAP
jgi:amino acid adenylation domain-containing protein